MERPSALLVTLAEGREMPKKFFAVKVVRQIEETVELIVQAPDEDSAQDAALEHLKTRGDEYQWQNPRKQLIVWRKRKIDTPAIVDVSI